MSYDDNPDDRYESHFSAEQLQRLRDWHEAAYQADAHDRDISVSYLGREFVIPPEVHPIQGMAGHFGRAVLEEVRPTDRVLDMGTGSGVNAILAASKARHVLAIDVNPVAVECAKQNAERNGVGDRVAVRESDVFQNVTDQFDLIIFDPPFRWFKPRDLRERGMADENYASLRTFFRNVKDHLRDGGRVLLTFGTSGDIDYLEQLIDGTGFQTEELAKKDLVKDGQTVSYYTYRLRLPETPITGDPTVASGAERSRETPVVTEGDVLDIYQLMESNGITLWLDGGWGVDALLGKQTRDHKDLDVAVQGKDIPKLRELLAGRRFRERGEDYARPFNYILTDDAGREFDLHIIELDAEGNGRYGADHGESFTAHALSGEGTIGGHKVHCIAPEDVVRFHAGYDLKETDFRDVSALCTAFGIELPTAYERFVAKDPGVRPHRR